MANDTAIAVFVGREQKFGIATTEFRGTLNKLGYTNIEFIVDNTKTWYNQQGIYQKLENQINQFISKHKDSRVVFMGSSMGGFGSILYANKIERCSKVIAFSPQIDIDPKLTLPWDDRYINNVKHINNLPFPTVSNLLRFDVQYDILYGNKEPRDKMHLDKLPQQSNVALRCIDGAGHNVPMFLRDNRQLDKVLQEVL